LVLVNISSYVFLPINETLLNYQKEKNSSSKAPLPVPPSGKLIHPFPFGGNKKEG